MHYDVSRNSKRCCVSGRELAPGEVYYSALVDTVTGLVRRDYSKEHWAGPPEDAVGHWRGCLEKAEGPAKPKPASVEEMLKLFDRLAPPEGAEEVDPKRTQLRYVLALLLIRRRALKLHSVERDESGEFLVVGRRRSKATCKVLDPQLSEEQIQQVELELAPLLEATNG